MRSLVGPVVATVMAAFLGHCNQGCGGTYARDIESAYIMETLGCVERAKTLEESQACRREVNKRYGLCRTEDWPRISPCDE
jgi:hypothetical protein